MVPVITIVNFVALTNNNDSSGSTLRYFSALPVARAAIADAYSVTTKNTMLDNSLGSIREKFSIKDAEDENITSIIIPKSFACYQLQSR